MSRTSPFQPLDGAFVVHAAPSTPRHVHPADSDYAWTFWLPRLGPATFVAWRILSTVPPGTTLDVDTTAGLFGVGRPALMHALHRLVQNRLALVDRAEPHILRVHRRAPQMTTGQLERICCHLPLLGELHQRWTNGVAA